jgi:Ca2+/H+ antiporter, TMEM165/GDT1 family
MSVLQFNFGVAAQSFLAVFPAELPDKSMFATLALTAKFGRKLPVWCGVAAAFAMHVVIATTVGGLLSQLPERAVAGAAAVLFGVGAVLMWRESREDEDEQRDEVDSLPASQQPDLRSFWGVVVASFAVLAVAELGDLTQFAVAGVAARTGEPLSAGIGGWVAEAAVAAIAVLTGGALLRRFKLSKMQLFAAAVFAVLAAVSFIAATTG